MTKQVPSTRGIIAELVSDHVGTSTVQNVPIYKYRKQR